MTYSELPILAQIRKSGFFREIEHLHAQVNRINALAFHAIPTTAVQLPAIGLLQKLPFRQYQSLSKTKSEDGI